MSRDESTFDFDFGSEEIKEEVTISEEVFISNVLQPKGYLINSHSLHGSLRIMHFRCEANKDYLKGSKFLLCKLLSSQIRILGYLSSIQGTVKKFCVGWFDFYNRYREVKQGMVDGILTDEKSKVLDKTPLGTTVFDSINGVEIYATAKSDGKKGDYIEGIFIYIKK